MSFCLSRTSKVAFDEISGGRDLFGEAYRTCSEYSHKTENNEFPCMAPRINLQMLLNSIRVHPELTFILSMVFHKCYCLVRILPLPLSDFQRNRCVILRSVKRASKCSPVLFSKLFFSPGGWM